MRDLKIRYLIETNGATPMEWQTRARYGAPGYGRPNAANLARHMIGMNASYAPGGTNAHLAGILHHTRAIIRDTDTGDVVAEWNEAA